MISKNKVGLVFGALLVAFHLAWIVIVALGWGQAILDFVFWAHMIHISVIIGPFDPVAALSLLAFTFVVGYVLGCAGAWIWSKVHAR